MSASRKTTGATLTTSRVNFCSRSSTLSLYDSSVSRRVRSVKSRTITTTSSLPDGTTGPRSRAPRRRWPAGTRPSARHGGRDGQRRTNCEATSGGRISRTLLPTISSVERQRLPPALRLEVRPVPGNPDIRSGMASSSARLRVSLRRSAWRPRSFSIASRAAERPRRAGCAGAGARRRGRARRAGGRPTRGRYEWSPGETCRAAARPGYRGRRRSSASSSSHVRKSSVGSPRTFRRPAWTCSGVGSAGTSRSSRAPPRYSRSRSSPARKKSGTSRRR